MLLELPVGVVLVLVLLLILLLLLVLLLLVVRLLCIVVVQAVTGAYFTVNSLFHMTGFLATFFMLLELQVVGVVLLKTLLLLLLY